MVMEPKPVSGPPRAVRSEERNASTPLTTAATQAFDEVVLCGEDCVVTPLGASVESNMAAPFIAVRRHGDKSLASPRHGSVNAPATCHGRFLLRDARAIRGPLLGWPWEVLPAAMS